MMKTAFHSLTLALALGGLVLTPILISNSAEASPNFEQRSMRGDGYKSGGYTKVGSHRGGYKKHKRGGWGKKHRRSWKRHHGGGYWRGHWGGHWGGGGHYGWRPGVSFGWHGHGSGTGAVIAGAAIGGALLYSAIDHASRPRERVIVREVPVPAPMPQQQARYPTQAAPQAGNAQPNGYDPSQCLQEREYTTTIMIGGVEKDAYGQACLMPDGSWKMGNPKPVPDGM